MFLRNPPGLTAVGAAVLTAVLLVISYVVGWPPEVLITALTGAVLVTPWFALPLAFRGTRGTRVVVCKPADPESKGLSVSRSRRPARVIAGQAKEKAGTAPIPRA